MQKFLSYYLGNWAIYKTNSLVLLLVRLLAGLGMLLHGLPKAAHPMAWAGESLPPLVQFLVVFFEIATPIFWFVGFLTPLFSLGLGLVMAGAMLTHMGRGDAFIARPPEASYELAVLYLLFCLILLFLGPGKFSLDYLLLNR